TGSQRFKDGETIQTDTAEARQGTRPAGEAERERGAPALEQGTPLAVLQAASSRRRPRYRRHPSRPAAPAGRVGPRPAGRRGDGVADSSTSSGRLRAKPPWPGTRTSSATSRSSAISRIVTSS